MICRQKGGIQILLFEYIGYCAIAYLQNSFLGKGFGDLPRAKMRMKNFIFDHFAFVFSCESFGMGMNSMRSIYQALYVLSTLPESLKVMVNSAEWDTCF